MVPSLYRRLLPFILALFAISLLAVAVIRPNTTHSMPYGLYLRLPACGAVEKGDLVQLESPMKQGYMGSHAGDNLLKRVEAVTGSGLIYVRGESDDSYDSRYFGLVGPGYIKARLIPLITSDRPLWAFGNTQESDFLEGEIK